jgi:hypothetical protein
MAVWFIMFDTTFNNISAISWRFGLLCNDLQNTGQKTKDGATRSPLKASAPEGLAVSTSLMTLVVLLLSDTNII